MENLFLAITFSVLVSVLLKLAKGRQIIVPQVIAFNYLLAGSLTYLLLKPTFNGLDINQFLLTSPEMPIFFALGILLPSVFIIFYQAIKLAGIAKTDAAQRLSLFLPILAAFFLFGQKATMANIIGVIFAFIALICLVYKPQNEQSARGKSYLFLALVWLGYGLCDILFKQIAKMGGAFANSLFVAFLLAGCFMFSYLVIRRTQWTLASAVCGLALGALNFFNILFYIRAHQYFSDNPTLVFTSMNIGVIIAGTLIGTFAFKEKMNKINLLGIIFGVLAILFLFYLERFL